MEKSSYTSVILVLSLGLSKAEQLDPILKLLKEHHFLRLNEDGKSVEIEVNPICLDEEKFGMNTD